ncbi:uncharacterized protein crebzf isoform X2 [Megalops cyprinoides]|uniref:uncharacterized protein crebzf isoform X2 n=1 Tax=Megalops cyprinoides TaxID=118141 RepID=UPI0018640248|nr:uncharacterized protein crebzf isoform X2 [Megalops cyprinoides]
MITRKRARIGPKSEPEPEATSCPVDVDASELIEVSDYVQSSPEQRFSPESEESPDLDLDDFFSVDDFNWQLDKDTLSSLLDLGESELPGLSSPTLKGNKSDSVPGMGRADGVRSLISHDGGVVQKPGCKNTVPGRINKNAIAARLNRLKKKEYVNGLESRVTSLAAENRNLRQENEHLNKRVEELEDETRSPTKTTTITPCRGKG